jgi:hypothetical protein
MVSNRLEKLVFELENTFPKRGRRFGKFPVRRLPDHSDEWFLESYFPKIHFTNCIWKSCWACPARMILSRKHKTHQEVSCCRLTFKSVDI